MLYKPLIALFMAFAATSGVVASTTPVRRGGIGAYPPTVGPKGDCEQNSYTACCDSLSSTNNLIGLADLLNLGPNVLSGNGCSNMDVVGTGAKCATNLACCKDVEQNGLVNVACVPIEL